MKQGDAYKRMTTFEGEDRNPVWAPDGNSYYYLSEQDGTFNVYHSTLDGSRTQLTHFKGNPVRYLTISDNGILSYAYNGELYTQAPGGKPSKVDVRIMTDMDPDKIIRSLSSGGATHVAVSPNGKEVAFIMNGDVYVTTMDFNTTKQITQTPERERRVDFRADGRAVVYDSERGGIWSIYESEIANDKEPVMTYCTDIKEKCLTDGVTTSFQPSYSPDGKKVAYLENREAIRVIDLKSGKIHTAMDAKYAYSYSDGDQYFTWSPDSKWILADYIGVGGWNSGDVALVPADGKSEPVNLTQSGYTDSRPKWVMGGKAMIFGSDRAGYRSHGSWGAHSDVYITFFDTEAYDKFRMNREDRAIQEEAEKLKGKKNEEKKDSADKEKKPEPLKLQLDNLDGRTMRLTFQSSHLSDAVMNNEGTVFIILRHTMVEWPCGCAISLMSVQK
jgi:Tol biopolymer transport system component